MKILKLIGFILLIANFVIAQPTGSYHDPSTNINDSSKYNTYLGTSILLEGTGGSGLDAQNNVGANAVIGANAFLKGVGTHNALMGFYSGAYINGSKNLAIGTNSGKFFDGDGNVALGYGAGVVVRGSGNVLIGHEAGYVLNDVDNQLYIHNTRDIETPLIYGDFAKKKVGIGTSDVPDEYALAVKGHIVAEEVTIKIYNDQPANNESGWADYVFDENYDLMSLPELEKEIKKLGHLPEVPSAEEVHENGYKVGEMDVTLLKKVEEMTLHLIEMNKAIKILQENEKELRKENEVLKNK